MFEYEKDHALRTFEEIGKEEFVIYQTASGQKTWLGKIFAGFPPAEIDEALRHHRVFAIRYIREIQKRKPMHRWWVTRRADFAYEQGARKV
jgi:hypothetical protein